MALRVHMAKNHPSAACMKPSYTQCMRCTKHIYFYDNDDDCEPSNGLGINGTKFLGRFVYLFLSAEHKLNGFLAAIRGLHTLYIVWLFISANC